MLHLVASSIVDAGVGRRV